MNNSSNINPAYWSRLERALEAIKAHPEHHYQKAWHCGSSHCFAGFAELQWLAEQNNERLEDLLQEQWSVNDLNPRITHSYFGIAPTAYSQIISADNTLADLDFFVHKIIENGGHALLATETAEIDNRKYLEARSRRD